MNFRDVKQYDVIELSDGCYASAWWTEENPARHIFDASESQHGGIYRTLSEANNELNRYLVRLSEEKAEAARRQAERK